MAIMKFEVEVYCKCGDELRVKESGDGTLEAQPCENCLLDKYNEGYDEGHEEAQDD